MKIIIFVLLILVLSVGCSIIGGCPNGYWSPSNHCDAICYGEDKGVYHFRMNEIKSVKGNYDEYICPCESRNITIGKTCV